MRQRRSMTVWFTDDAIAAWAAAPRTTRGGQPSCSLVAILTALTLRAVFRLLSASWGSIGSIISLLGLNPAGAGSYSHSLVACRPVTRGELTDQRCSGADLLADMLVGRAIIVEAAGERRVPGGRSELGHPDRTLFSAAERGDRHGFQPCAGRTVLDLCDTSHQRRFSGKCDPTGRRTPPPITERPLRYFCARQSLLEATHIQHA